MTTDQQDATPPPLAASYDSALEEPEELTPEQIQRKAEIAIYDELREAQIAFHLKTAAFVMSLDHYKRIRRVLGGVEEDPAEPWHPVQGDMLNGYSIMVEGDVDNPPHIEMVDKDLRPPYYAGVTSLGIERKDITPPKFEEARSDDAPSAP